VWIDVSDNKENILLALVLVVMLAVTAASLLKEPEQELIPIEFGASLDLSNDDAVEKQIIFYLVNRDSEPDVTTLVNYDTVDTDYNISIKLNGVIDVKGTSYENKTRASRIRFFGASFMDYEKPEVVLNIMGWIDENRRIHELDVFDIEWEPASSQHGGFWTPGEYKINPVSKTVEASNRFALDLYGRFNASSDNLLFSPYSISTALSMVYEGARGTTAEEMENVFHFNNDTAKRLEENSELYDALNSVGDVELDTANALWLQQGYPFIEEYVTRLTEYYHGEAKEQNFAGNPEEARLEINKWVEDQTNQKIKDLFPEGSLNPDVRLVLTNAIYFKGDWLHQFNPNNTERQPFYVSDTQIATVDMMALRRESFNYAEAEGVQLLELPYKNSGLSMVLLLPVNQTLTELESGLDYDTLMGWISSLKEDKVNVYLPRFSYETKCFMKDILSEMGMPTAFTPGEANLTGINPDGDLFISKVIHQAFIDVNEEGTEAAAATGVVVELYAMLHMYEFRADHPFIYMIMDKETGSILFMGRVVNPAA
jgi:serine protease inhibitor